MYLESIVMPGVRLLLGIPISYTLCQHLAILFLILLPASASWKATDDGPNEWGHFTSMGDPDGVLPS